MQDYTKKLMSLRGGEVQTGLPSAIFGSAGTLNQNLDNRERIRIGLWPIVSDDEPTLAMGLASVLAALLERAPDVRVYRLFVQPEGVPEDYTWSIEQSQFDVEDWEVDMLDENAAAWGTLQKIDSGYHLTIEMEDDLTDDPEGETSVITYEAVSLHELVSLLPQIAEEMNAIVEARTPFIPAYNPTTADDRTLSDLLTKLLHWQINLSLSLWGKPWADTDINSALDGLITKGKVINDAFSAWAVSSAIAHALLPGYEDTHGPVNSQLNTIVETFETYPIANVLIARAQFLLGRARQGYDLLETTLEAHPKSRAGWLILGELYREGGRLLDAVDAFQRGIEEEIADKLFYMRYVDLLYALTTNEFVLEEFVLIEPDDYPTNQLIAQEAIAGYDEALRLDPKDTRLLQRQILQLIALRNDEQIWDQLETLIELDETGDVVRSIADAVYILDDISPMIEILERATKKHPNRVDLYINLAVVFITDEREDDALDMLEKAEDLTDDPIILNDIDRLYLIADDPEFEARIGEITALVGSGARISSGDLDYLEDILEEAPGLTEIYVLLGKAYLALGQGDAALETLLDGHEQAPDDPELIVVLAQILWGSDQKELAFDYLNKGIQATPNYVPILSLTGQYLFEAGQEENARTYLARAEAISPKHRALEQARRNISEMINRKD